MKKISLIIVIAICFFMISCSTTGFAGLAKESYVSDLDQKTSSEIEELKSDMSKIKEQTTKLDDLLKEIEESKKATLDYQKSVKDLEQSVKSLPKTTIQKLIQILQKHLDDAE